MAGSGRERQETVGWCQYWVGLYTTSFPPQIYHVVPCAGHTYLALQHAH